MDPFVIPFVQITFVEIYHYIAILRPCIPEDITLCVRAEDLPGCDQEIV